MKRMTAQVK